jgi:histidinol-phosphate phosphatase family protein
MKRRGIFFDRDGVLNRVIMRGNIVGSPRSMAEFQVFPEAGRALSIAAERGVVVIVTNQPDLGHGLLAQKDLELMHVQLMQVASGKIRKILWEGSNAPEHPRRKPSPAMILEAAKELDLELSTSWIIGDSIKDLLAGKQAGIGTVLMQTAYNHDIHGQGDLNLESPTDLLQWLQSLPVVTANTTV